MESPALGIDLGTTNSVVAVADGRQARVLADAEGRRLIPSVVSFHPDGSILVGHDARERRLVDAPNTIYSTKRLIGRPYDSPEVRRAKERLAFTLEPSATGAVQVRVRRGTFALPEISAMVLRHLRTTAEAALGTTCKQAVITVPANFNELQRSATQAAGKVAGLEVLRVLNEPTAATLAYGYGKEKPESIAVYDLGGGTFDLTLLDLEKDVFEVVSTAGDTFLGGDDIDVLVADKMCNQCLAEHRYDPRVDPQTYERLRAAAEWAKCQLSAVNDVDVTIEELFQDGRGRTIDFQFHMTREELDVLSQPLIARSFDVVNDAMRAAGRRPRDVHSVVLVGGSTRMPLVRKMVAEHFGREPRADIDPDLVVAQGAAIHAFTLRGQQPAAQDPGAAAKALARAAAPAIRKPTMPLPTAKGTPMARVPLVRKQQAFAPEDPRDRTVPEEATRIAPAPARRPLVVEETRAAPMPEQPTRVAAPEEATRIASAPKRGGTSPLGLEPAARKPVVPSRPPARPALDELEDEPTMIGRRPAAPAPSLAEGQELSTPFLEPPSAVAVVATRAIGVAAPLPREPVRSSPLMDLDPVESLPPKRAPREPTMQIGTGNAAAPSPNESAAKRPPREPTMQIGTGPQARAVEPAPIRPPTSPGRAPTGTWGAPADVGPPPPPPPRGAPPPPPPRAPDREKIQQALHNVPEPAPPALPEPASSPGMSWSDFGVSIPPPSAAPLGGVFAQQSAGLPVPDMSPSPQAMAPRQPIVAMPDRPAPLLMDVTPLSLGLETVGGFVQQLVARNAPIPTEKTRIFSTGKDEQTEVEVRICQGDSNVFQQNQALGAVSLTQLRKARRGEVRIEVTFMIDASGILDVKATDLDTKRVQAIRIALKGGATDAEVDAMRARQAQLFPSS